MSVSITFEPSGISGVVAQGTYLIDAARRMGAPLGAGCTSGKGECPACLVSVKAGADLLSPPSLVEENQLGSEHLDQSLRLACQVKIENHGDVVVMAATRPQTRPADEETAAELLKKFGALPLSKKLATLMQFETIAMSEAFDAAIEKPLAFGSKTFDAFMGRARAARARKAETK
ncbi:MAG TPA: 2Fe-2S iron-sulfur cluster-binding protein [Pyrinomonadaceae bacterium]|jgi:ferredoxin|nr:2Fe-2S iron-sulfur cluster-binding protein [Pyrinomonadaceae bacterium]